VLEQIKENRRTITISEDRAEALMHEVYDDSDSGLFSFFSTSKPLTRRGTIDSNRDKASPLKDEMSIDVGKINLKMLDSVNSPVEK
jgi:hypothetical protein